MKGYNGVPFNNMDCFVKTSEHLTFAITQSTTNSLLLKEQQLTDVAAIPSMHIQIIRRYENSEH